MVIVRLLSLLMLVLALMLLGADVITTLEAGGQFMVRSSDHILGLVHASPSAWLEMNLPAVVAGALTTALSWPAWMPLGVIGVILALISGRRE